ncbi:hypothetical protein [Bartonella sp. DGB1]|uniref:hypothetical protein n=1 Tax=Bartonella sp. DGB1 TaxID=3239807 RepID=UPI003525AABF
MYILRYFLSVVLFFISINMVSAAHKPEVPTLTLYDISSPPTLDPTFSDDPTSQNGY